MKAPLEVISEYGIPIDSFVAAVQYINAEDEAHQADRLGTLSKEAYEAGVAEIIGLDTAPVYLNHKMSKIYFAYAVQETIRFFNTGERVEMSDVWDEVNRRAEGMIKNAPWAIKDYTNEDESGEPKLDAAGNPKQKKGAKKELAKKVWTDNADKQTSMPRKDWIALLCTEVGLTPAGASTYYANLKKGRL